MTIFQQLSYVRTLQRDSGETYGPVLLDFTQPFAEFQEIL
jgi:hypothetical protein